MEQVNIVPLTQQHTDLEASLTLEQAREQIRSLLRESEANAWEIGDLLNRIEKSGIVRSKGYGKTRTWLEAEVPEAKGKASTLYRYAYVATYYTKEQVKTWGIARLEYLMIHDQETEGHVTPGDPSQREVQVVQKNGSTVVKKFCDCTSKELRRSNQLRKNPRNQSGKAARVAKTNATGQAAHDAPDAPTHSAIVAVLFLVAGVVMMGLSEVLPLEMTWWLFLIGLFLFFAGVGALLRHWGVIWKGFLAAAREGRGVAFVKETLANVRQGTRKAIATVRSNLKSKPPVRSEQEPPPTEKKAA